MLSLRASSKQTFSSLYTFLFDIHLFHVYSSFFFWCLVQSGLFLFLKLAFLCYSSTALAGGYSCVTLTSPPVPHQNRLVQLARAKGAKNGKQTQQVLEASNPDIATSSNKTSCFQPFHDWMSRAVLYSLKKNNVFLLRCRPSLHGPHDLITLDGI